MAKRKYKKILYICMVSLLMVGAVLTQPMSIHADKECGFCIKIIHTNDIHARVQENEKSGIIGMERLKTIIDTETAGADIDLVLDSGDLFHGQPIATLVQGESVANLVRACGYDAMTAGNHDWNYGKDRLKELADMAGVAMLTGNVADETGEAFFDEEFYTEEVTKDGQTLKVGVFGVTDPDMYTYTAPENVAGLTFTDAVEYAQKASAELKKQGCDIIIALAHANHPVELASKVNGVNLWLCGHEHMSINTTVTMPDGSTAYVIENGSYSNEIGFVEMDCVKEEDGSVSIHFASDTYDMQYVAQYEKDADVEAVMNDITSKQEQVLARKVGTTPVKLDGVWEHLRIGETNLGRVAADSYLLTTGADVAFENAGGIRASVEAGDVTYGDVIGVSPYGNYIVTKKITGQKLKEILETSIEIQLQNIVANDSGEYDAWPNNSGSYLQTAGMTVEYNPALEKGSRVISVRVGDTKLDEQMLYTVATNQFTATSSDYPQLADATVIGEYSACDEAIVSYFKQGSETVAASNARKGMIQVDTTPSGEETNPIQPDDPSQEPAQPEPSPVVPEGADNPQNQTEGTETPQPSATGAEKTGTSAPGANGQEVSSKKAPGTGDDACMTACIVVMALSAGVLVRFGARSWWLKQESH